MALAAPYPSTLCPFQILLLEKPREEVATDYDNDTDGYEE